MSPVDSAPVTTIPLVRNGQAYSTNPSSVYARLQAAQRSPADNVERNARRADYKAMMYARKKIIDSDEYKLMRPTEREEILRKRLAGVMETR
jgi:hypothetical protein